MKQRIVFFLLLATGLVACINDDSTYGDGSINIDISGIDDTYTLVSYNGQHLRISPVVSCTLGEEDLEYEWSYYSQADVQAAQNYMYTKDRLAVAIADTKTLDYEMNLPDGEYKFILTVHSKRTDYRKTYMTTVNTASALSKGFYILKETADGNTDLDMLNTDNGERISNLLQTLQGRTLSGKPRALDALYNMAYVDPETEDATYGNTICVTTEQDEVRWIRVLDCQTVRDAGNCHFETVDGEIPYRSMRGMYEQYYITNNGIYGSYGASLGGAGIFGATSGNGGSTHAFLTPEGYFLLYWNAQTRSICVADYNNFEAEVTGTVNGRSAVNTNLDCLKCGMSSAGDGVAYFLLQDRDNPSQKYMYYLSIDMVEIALTDVKEIDASSHLAQATALGTCASQATIVYAVDAGKVYAVDLTQNLPDRQLTFAGLPDSETVTYISNREGGVISPFNYLLVATQSASGYKLYFYNIVGGEPTGEPVRVINGTGRLKSVNYIEPTSNEYYPGAVLDD